eukprot:363631-Chlamydomonas_euryale.AAC.8
MCVCMPIRSGLQAVRIARFHGIANTKHLKRVLHAYDDSLFFLCCAEIFSSRGNNPKGLEHYQKRI